MTATFLQSLPLGAFVLAAVEHRSRMASPQHKVTLACLAILFSVRWVAWHVSQWRIQCLSLAQKHAKLHPIVKVHKHQRHAMLHRDVRAHTHEMVPARHWKAISGDLVLENTARAGRSHHLSKD